MEIMKPYGNYLNNTKPIGESFTIVYQLIDFNYKTS